MTPNAPPCCCVFFQNKSLRDVGLALGVSEEAARKRVDRAVERLGVFLTRHGATAGPGALASFIAANAVQAAPAGLMASVCASAAPIGMLPVSAAITLTKTVAMTTLQKTLVSAALAISAALVSYLTYEVSSERSQLRQLHIEQADLARQIDPLRRERDDAINAAALAHNEAERLRRDNAQVVRLRGDLGRMTTELSQAKASGTNRVSAVSAEVAGWIDRGDIIKQWFKDHPDKSIPELRLLWNENWLFAARDNKTIATNRNEGNTIDMIASNLRQESKNLLANILGHALSLYVANHNGQLPANLSDLIPYTPRQEGNPITETSVTSAEPVDETMLGRYELRYTGAISQVPADESIIAETTPVDPTVDLLLQIKANGYAYTSVGIRDMYAEQLHRWSDKDAAQLKPFLKK